MNSSSSDMPIRFENILLTSDFSDTSARALPYAAAFARRFNSKLYIAHVITPDEYSHIPEAQRNAALVQMKAQAEKQIEAVLATAQFAGIPHEVLLDHGEILPLLSRIVHSRAVDLIVTGTHGKHGLQKLLSGSTAEEIFRIASLPVLAIGPQVAIGPQEEVRIERLLYVADFRSGSIRAMRYAYELARAYSAQLYFLHVVQDIWREPASTRLSGDAFFREQLRANGLPETAEGIQPDFLVEFGSPEDLTLEALQKRDIQLVIVNVPGTTHPVLTAHLPGPAAYNLVTHARCPVLGIRTEAEQGNRTGHAAAD